MDCVPEIMDAGRSPCLYLYTSVLTVNPRAWYIPLPGIWLYTAYTFKNVFSYTENDVYWCTADIGWITGISILYTSFGQWWPPP